MADRPNLLLIFTDMQRADTIHALGNAVIRTPAWDRLTREGTAFTSTYTPSPVCVSARYAMHYGRWPSATMVTENQKMLPDAGDSLPARLSAAGYRTHAAGKLHFNPDWLALRGFGSRDTQEEIVGVREQDDYLRYLLAQGFGHICDPHGVRGEMYYIPQVAQMPAEHHPTQWVADRTIDFIRAQDARAPWMCMASFIHPHPPFAPPNPWHKLYRGFDMPLPNVPPEREYLLTWINRMQNRWKYRDQGFDQNLLRMMKAAYYACISFVDHQIGRLIATLEANGVLDATLVLVTSDHGEFLGDLGCFGKRSMHDPSSRVPLVARLPGRLPAGARIATPASLVDVPTTLLAAAGASRDGMVGEDLADLAANRSARRAVYSQCGSGGHAQYMVLTDQWKFIYSAPDQKELLFDRLADPFESRNRAGLPSCAGVLSRLRTQLQRFLADCKTTDALETSHGEALHWKVHPRLEVSADPDAGLGVQDHPWAIQDIEGYTSVQAPAIQRWQVLGPFLVAAASGRLIDHLLPIEAEVLRAPAALVARATAAAQGEGGTARPQRTGAPIDQAVAGAPVLPAWRAASADGRGILDLGRLLGYHDHAIAYAVTEIESPEARRTVLRCGSDDGIALWLNGECVHRFEVARGVNLDDDEVEISLKPGVNVLVAKISNLSGGWGFGVQVV